jgi:hypothetical protein
MPITALSNFTDGLIGESKGHFGAADYERQLKGASF